MRIWQKEVEYDLGESGVHPISIRDLVRDPARIDELLDLELNYPHIAGDPELRERIAALYPGATPDNVLVTVGAIQSNHLILLTTTAPGDDVAVMQPNYQQLWGTAQNMGRRLSTFALKPELGWQLDREELAAAVKPTTRLVTVVNPNNPTGRIMTAADREAVLETTARAGAWLLADEVYAGAERISDEFTPSFYGQYERVLAVNSLSKVYGLAGLRLGWVVGPVDLIGQLESRADYITICATVLANKLAAIALEPEVRERLLARARAYVRRGFDNVQTWAAGRDDIEVAAPDASAICFARYRKDIGSVDLATLLAREKRVMIVPGAFFGMEHHLRLAFGMPDDYVREGLRRLGELLDDVE
jgi:aspartate/methionine/tyrosine aminotransferase